MPVLIGRKSVAIERDRLRSAFLFAPLDRPEPERGDTAHVACRVCGRRRLHRSRCPVLILKSRVVASTLATAGAVGLVLHAVKGSSVNIMLAMTTLLVGAAALVGLAFLRQRK